MIVQPSRIDTVRANPITGEPEINPDRWKAQGWSQGTQANARVSLAASGTGEDNITIQPEDGTIGGDFEASHLTYDTLAAFRAELYVGGGTNKRFMNVPIHCDLLMGAGMLPLYFPVPMFIECRNALNIKFTNLAQTLTTNLVRVVAHGRRYLNYESEAERKRLLARAFARREWPFWLGLDNTSVTLAADATGNRQQMTMSSDGDLEAEYLLVKTQSPVRIILQTASGRPFVRGGSAAATTGVQGSHITGCGIFAYRFSTPILVERTTIMEAYLDNLVDATNTVEMALVGRCLDYPRGRQLGIASSPDQIRARPLTPGESAGGIAVPLVPNMAVPGLGYQRGPSWLSR